MRLTNDMRIMIVQAVMRHRFAAEVQEVLRAENALAQEVYALTFTDWERELIAEIPNGWLDRLSEIAASFGGQITMLTLMPGFCVRGESSKRHDHYTFRISFDRTDQVVNFPLP